MMHMLGRGQWVRQGSMQSDARVSGEYATKGLVGERILVEQPVCLRGGGKGLARAGAPRPRLRKAGTCGLYMHRTIKG